MAEEEGAHSSEEFLLSETANVTNIVNSLEMYPNLQAHLNGMVQNSAVITTTVHGSYEYEELVNENRAWLYVAEAYKSIFLRQLYILKEESPEIYQATCAEECYLIVAGQIALEDAPTAFGMNATRRRNLMDYIRGISDRVGELVNSYREFKRAENNTIDILEHVYNTAMLRKVYFRGRIEPYNWIELNSENIQDICNYVAGIGNLNNAEINRTLSNNYYRAVADFILNDTIYGIKTSKNTSELQNDDGFLQLILYALAIYIAESREIRKFKIYNALLGEEYFMEIPNLNFRELLTKVREYADRF